MPDYQEIEIKFILEDAAAMRDALIGLGASSHGCHTETNIRLDDGARSLSACGIVLRVRRIEKDGKTTYLLTVKTPVESDRTGFKVRREIELEVSDGPAVLAALDVLGFTPYWCYEKRRETFTWDKVEAVIDEMPFGWFMELEGPEADIQVLAEKLALDTADGLTQSYAQLFEQVCRALSLDVTDLTFNAFSDITVEPQVFQAKYKLDK